jgi:hypothetical protein
MQKLRVVCMLERLKMTRIHFLNKEDKERGFYAMMISGEPVRCLPFGKYVVRQKHLDILKEMKIEYMDLDQKGRSLYGI